MINPYIFTDPLSVNISHDANVPLDTSTFNMTVIFSRPVVELLTGDFSLANCSLGSIYTNDNITFEVAVTPSFAGSITISIPAGNVVGDAGGLNEESNQISITVASDYTTNIFDEWFPHRASRINVGGTKVATWIGIKNSKQLLGQGTIFPTGKKYSLSGTNYFNVSNATTTGWSGNFSLFIRVRSGSTLSNATEVIWDSTGGDNLRLYAKVSSGSPRVGIRVVSTIYTATTATWPQDSNDHYVGFCVDFPAGTCRYYVDGSLVETISFTAATGINYTGTWSGALGRLSSTVYYSQSFDKLRIYQEAVSDTNSKLLTNASNLFASFTDADPGQSKVYVFMGESIMRGHTAGPSDMPIELQQTLTDILGWANTTDGFEVTLAGSTPRTECGPQLKALYDLRIKYPDHNIFYFYGGSAGSTLDLTPTSVNSWNSGGSGNLYNTALASFLNGMKVLIDIEDRNIESIEIIMAQGINDCDDATRAGNYSTNLSNALSDIRSDFTYGGISATRIVWSGPHSSLPPVSFPYTSTVKTAFITVFGADLDSAYLFPDDNTEYPKEAGDNVHLTPAGTVNLGKYFATQL